MPTIETGAEHMTLADVLDVIIASGRDHFILRDGRMVLAKNFRASIGNGPWGQDYWIRWNRYIVRGTEMFAMIDPPLSKGWYRNDAQP